MNKSIEKKASKIKLLILDVDGVLTDGSIYYHADATHSKAFNVPDGLGMKMLMRSGVTIAIISGKSSLATKLRLEELGVKHIYLGHENKNAIFASLKSELKISNEAIACVGDDIPDVAILRQVGLGIAVKNATSQAKKAAAIITKNSGGKGAVREVCELIMKAQKTLKAEEARYFS